MRAFITDSHACFGTVLGDRIYATYIILSLSLSSSLVASSTRR